MRKNYYKLYPLALIKNYYKLYCLAYNKGKGLQPLVISQQSDHQTTNSEFKLNFHFVNFYINYLKQICIQMYVSPRIPMCLIHIFVSQSTHLYEIVPKPNIVGK